MRELGVGVVYWPALAPLFESGAVALLELEPQTLWKKTWRSDAFAYELNEELFESIAAYPQPKLLHGVGQPVAGTVDDAAQYLPLLQRMARRLQPAWISEHLSFNRVRHGEGVVECGFLLPPSQTVGAARMAARNIARYATAMECPFAFETGVNYFPPTEGHLNDGCFFGAVAEMADCGILLDLHNLWCNERNGRQPVADAIAAMPLDRVWEVHVAGGSSLDGMWLDAHDGPMPSELEEVAARVIPQLPNLGALVFEVLPEHLSRIGIDGVQRQLHVLERLWGTRRGQPIRVERPRPGDFVVAISDETEVSAWEQRLFDVLSGRAEGDPWSAQPGCLVLTRLIRDARSASLARGLRFTTTALLASLGRDGVAGLLSDYFRSAPPDAFVAIECNQFARFLNGRPDVVLSVPYLQEVIVFEQALLSATLFGTTTVVDWSVDPTELFAALELGQLPVSLPHAASRMTIYA